MKIYEKPKLMVLSVSANDALCSCTHPTLTLTGDLNGTLGFLDGDGNGILDENELASFTFAMDEGCQGNTLDITGYCKFSGVQMVFSS